MLSKLNSLGVKILYVSKLTNVKNKKIRILLSVFLSNAAVALDVIIIVIFASILNNKISYTNKFIIEILDFLMASNFILPFLVLLRFTFLFAEKLNIEKLALDVIVSLRSYLMKEAFHKGNLSISDSYFYINQVSGHFSFFYRSFATFKYMCTNYWLFNIFIFFRTQCIQCIYFWWFSIDDSNKIFS